MPIKFNTTAATAESRVCSHPSVTPAFDERAIDLPADEVRRLWPRFEGTCPDCGQQVIAYASTRHYLAGDW